MTKSKLTTWNCADMKDCYCEQVIIFSTVQTSGPLWEQSTSNQCGSMSAHKWMISANCEKPVVIWRCLWKARFYETQSTISNCMSLLYDPDKFRLILQYWPILMYKMSIFVRYLKSFTPIRLCVYSNRTTSLEKVCILYDRIYIFTAHL